MLAHRNNAARCQPSNLAVPVVRDELVVANDEIAGGVAYTTYIYLCDEHETQ